MIIHRAPLMLEEETQSSEVCFPIYSENSDVIEVGYFLEKQSFILADVKDLLQ